MNIELLKKKMKHFFETTSPEELILKFEKMGYTFVEIDKSPSPVQGVEELVNNWIGWYCKRVSLEDYAIEYLKIALAGIINSWQQSQSNAGEQDTVALLKRCMPYISDMNADNTHEPSVGLFQDNELAKLDFELKQKYSITKSGNAG